MLVHKNSKKLLLNVSNPARITEVIPTAKTFTYKGRLLVAVPHRDDETKVLRNLGFNAPSPVLYYYGWPSIFPKVFDHQRETVKFLTDNRRAFCLNDMGTMKTLSTLWAFDYLKTTGSVRKALIVSPLSTLERAWGDEIWRNFPHLTFSVLHGSRDKRLKLLEEDVDIYLINHDGVKVNGLKQALAKRPDIDIVIIDEVASFRNHSTDRWKAMNEICNKQSPRRIWGLTGTPTPNEPTDAWAQCRLIVPERVPIYFSKFRDMTMKQITQFKWAPRDNALDVVFEAMQPSIRYKRSECIDLPECVYQTRHAEMTDPQKKAYKLMLSKLAFEVGEHQVLAVNEAVKASKLVQIACIEYTTPVLTISGWKKISDVTVEDKLWDGVEWVTHGGAVFNGVKPVMICHGVTMTADHKVLTTSGWLSAEEAVNGYASGKLDWEKVRTPDGYQPQRIDIRESQVREVALPVRLRANGYSNQSISPVKTSDDRQKLWVHARESNSWADKNYGVQHLGENEISVPISERQRLQKLRGPWNYCLRALAQVRELLCRYGRAPSWVYPWANRQRRSVQSGELPVGDYSAAGAQHSGKQNPDYTCGRNDTDTSREILQHPKRYVSCENKPRVDSVRCSTKTSKVYDILDCGPRNRFVVQGDNGELLTVHNCGAAYADEGVTVHLDVSTRIELVKEVIEEAGAKVIVFVPFTAALEHVARELGKYWEVAIVHGDTKKAERDDIFTRFQRDDRLRVIVANPATMSHGLTLTAANTVVWFAPPVSNEIYEQANARVTRPGQKLSQLIVMIEGCDVERRIYKRLQGKQKMQGLLLDMLEVA